MHCTLTMEELMTAPYNLVFDQLVQVRATATNSYGSALLASEPNQDGARIRTVPNQMLIPFEVLSTDTTIQVGWLDLEAPATGNAPVLSYNLYWDNGSGVADIELVDEMVTEFRVTGLVGGLNYRFKVRARNNYGYGDFSAEYSLEASDLPGRPEIPTVTLDGTNVLIQWQAPNNHFSAIEAYQIMLKTSSNSFVEDLTNCDGSIVTDECRIPMLEITPITGLITDQLIQVKVRAQNANGWGSFSEINIRGQKVNSLPHKIAAPTIDLTEVFNT